MNKRLLWIGVALLMIFSAGALLAKNQQQTQVISHAYTFKGESLNWAAQFQVDAREIFDEKDKVTDYSSKSSERFTLVYKGELSELAGLKVLTYEYEGMTGKGSSERTFTTPPTSKEFVQVSHSSNGALERKESTIEVTVEWNGMVERFPLTVH